MIRQLSMAQIIKDSQYISFALYFFCNCSWGSCPALSSGGNETAFRNARSPNSRGCLSLDLNNRSPTKHPKREKGTGLTPARKKIKNQKKREKKKEEGELWISVTMEFIYGCLESGVQGVEGEKVSVRPPPPFLVF